jgi:hypothetical protein
VGFRSRPSTQRAILLKEWNKRSKIVFFTFVDRYWLVDRSSPMKQASYYAPSLLPYHPGASYWKLNLVHETQSRRDATKSFKGPRNPPLASFYPRLHFQYTQMHRRIRVRDAVTPYCVSIERQFPPILPQPFRRLQHLVFGLTQDEWDTLSTYFAHFEDLGVTVQLETWPEREFERLKGILIDEIGRGEPLAPDRVHQYADIIHQRAMNKQASRLTLDRWKAMADSLMGTAISRGLRSNRGLPYWWYSRWLNKQCAQAGGCCGRGCKCCTSREVRDLDFRTWGGHCTPACSCCLQHLGVDGAIEQLASGREPRFDSREVRRNRFNRKMLNAYAFGLW